MFKIVMLLLAAMLGVATAGGIPAAHFVKYGYNIGGGGAYGGYGAANVKVQQDPFAYNYGIQTHANGGNSFINQGAQFGAYGAY